VGEEEEARSVALGVGGGRLVLKGVVGVERGGQELEMSLRGRGEGFVVFFDEMALLKRKGNGFEREGARQLAIEQRRMP
jgi:hypothetical protein